MGKNIKQEKFDYNCFKYSHSCKRCPEYSKCYEEVKEKTMKRTCARCGKIVDFDNHICPYRKYKKKESTDITRFRNTKGWLHKSIEIRQRDKYLCKICLLGKYDTYNTLNYKDLSVHHIVPLQEDFNKRLDNDNLITLCSYHHKMAEDGKIPREELLDIVKEIPRQYSSEK